MNTTIPLTMACPAPGKPNPSYAPPQGLASDNRPRVDQAASKFNQCWYYALNTVRVRQGKHPSVQSTPARLFEQHASSFRKKVTAHEKSIPGICDQLGQPKVEQVLARCTIAEAPRFIQLHRAGLPLLGDDTLPSLISFAAQKKFATFYDFLVDKKFNQRAMLQEIFLSYLGIEPASAYSHSFWARCADLPSAYQGLSVHQKSTFLGGLVRLQCIRGYQLELASWDPQSPFNSLVSILKKRGAAVAFGSFGQNCYDSPPLLLAEQAEGRPVYGWRPASAKAQDFLVGHAITIVGCDQRAGGKARIYYIDPDDSSPFGQQRKVYTLSYQSFVDRSKDVYGICGPNPTPNGYLVTRKP